MVDPEDAVTGSWLPCPVHDGKTRTDHRRARGAAVPAENPEDLTENPKRLSCEFAALIQHI